MDQVNRDDFSDNPRRPLMQPASATGTFGDDCHRSSFPDSGVENFDKGAVSRALAFLGLGISITFGVVCLAGGYYASSHARHHPDPDPSTYQFGWTMDDHSMEREYIGLALNILVTICTEAIGFVHSVSLRTTLVEEKRLHFATNLRLLTAARGNFGNGTIMNMIMAFLLVTSYASSSMIIPQSTWNEKAQQPTTQTALAIWPIPLIILGVVLLLQSIIAIAGILAIPNGIHTWSRSQLDLTAAAIHHRVIYHRPGNCLRSVCDQHRPDGSPPIHPASHQPSPWNSHPRVQKVIWFIWVLWPAYFISGAVIIQLTRPAPSFKGLSWSFPPSPHTSYTYSWYPTTSNSTGGVIVAFIMVIIAQSPLTMVLHGCEIITSIVRDEKAWQQASSSGALMSSSPVTIAKDYWTFGLAFESSGIIVVVRPEQFFYLAIFMAIFTCIIFLLAYHSPKSLQPAAYGHLETLADLIDFWPARDGKMFWGDKSIMMGIPYNEVGHADTPQIRGTRATKVGLILKYMVYLF
ncbi:hypothetical protein HWV62_14992 [Athelia sp. TMB]|nr:hypothetical protein HWV62_14992 [Athelia sp. TMB]